MDPNRFDSISKLFASRKTRRSALKGTGAGLAAAAIAPLAGRAVTAQDATPTAIDPNDPHPSADTATADPEFLFVQPFDGGTWAPKDGEDGTYTLTLTGAAAQTVYFSDRPERIVGLSPTDQFLDQLGFTPDNPPNAALVAQTDASEQEVLVIELLNPQYDAESATLTYDARVLADYAHPGLAHLARQQQDYELPESFSEGSLFIDDCSDGEVTCYTDNGDQELGTITIGNCYHFPGGCRPCHDLDMECADHFPSHCHVCNEYTEDGTNCLQWGTVCHAD